MSAMLKILHQVEGQLPQLLQEREAWKGVDITYHPPRVERLWRQVGDIRVSLHRIYPCSPEEALFHPHPWPQAIRVLSGEYEMGIGQSATLEVPPVVCRLRVTGDFEYAMEDPSGWHYVCPLRQPSLSIMITGLPWERPVIKSQIPLTELTLTQRKELFQIFSEYYSV